MPGKLLLCLVPAKVTSLVSETLNKACAGYLWQTGPPEQWVVKPRCAKSRAQDTHHVSTSSKVLHRAKQLRFPGR